MKSPFLYSITFKSFSSQPDIPWGVMKHLGTIEECFDTNFMYFDGYDLAFGDGDVAQKRQHGYKQGLRAKPDSLTEQYGAKLKSEVSTILRNKSLAEMQEALLLYGDDWERRCVVPYIQGFLDAEAEKNKHSEILAAVDDDE